ncbi:MULTISPECIES: hypothetical protein [Vibrio harveyi group]|nr:MULTISPECIES: hypothetical protein [Vibrio harveyi group]EGR1391684.1 hypothetical protein [Vibrio parahaemolyticus]EGR2044945.1 hypothetical protein [Vibrio parahaemolyticus]EGR2184561.1 hypothetical protein [Vibrio parahaemolyticus]EGR2264044.1 hypothetical protein [Vibrio parahaemolyticus]EHK0031251.1 hypothetical protein [Vibrio parahaemolyticus]
MKGFGIGSIVSIGTLILIVIWLGYYVVFRNVSAKDLVFSYTTLVAAMMMFILNVFFSLQSETVEKQVHSNITHQNKSVEPYKHRNAANKSSFIVFNRDVVPMYSGVPFSTDRFNSLDERIGLMSKLKECMKVYLIGAFVNDFCDWNPKTEQFVGRNYGSFRYDKKNVGKDRFYSYKELIAACNLNITEEILSKNNIAKGLIIPEGSTISGDSEGIYFDNPHFTLSIKFAFDHNFGRNPTFRADGTYYFDHTIEHESSFNIYACRVDICMFHKKHLSGSPKKSIYANWANSVFDMIEKNFDVLA